MHPTVRRLLDEHAGAIASACDRAHVTRLDLFGSAATGEGFDPDRSDLDFVIHFEEAHFTGMADAFLGLAESLEVLLGRPVDLLTDRSIRNPFFRQAVNQSRVPVYDAGDAEVAP